MQLWPLYRALAGLGVACAALVAVAYELSAPIVEKKRLAALERTVQEVVPGTSRTSPFTWTGDAFEPAVEAAAADVWAAYGDGGLLGVAVTGATMGYQDTVRVLWGYDPQRDLIVGMRVLESRETPGLGDRVGFEPVFLDAFTRLDASLDGDALVHPPRLSDGRAPEEPGEIDGLSGATISSQAVVTAVGEAAAVWVPRLEAGLGDLRPGPQGGETQSSEPQDGEQVTSSLDRRAGASPAPTVALASAPSEIAATFARRPSPADESTRTAAPASAP